MTCGLLRPVAAFAAAAIISACGGSAPTSPSQVSTPAPTPAPTAPPTATTPSAVRVECASAVIRTERITCRAIAVTPSLAWQGDRFGRLLDTDVTERASWSSQNSSIATVSAGQVEGLAIGSTSIEASFSGTTGRATVEVKKNATDLIDGAAGRYRASGVLLTNSCRNTNPLPSYVGEIIIEQVGVRTRNVQLSYEGRLQRTFRASFDANPATGELRFESDALVSPFGPASSVQSTKISAASSASGEITSVREEMSCGDGTIIFRIDTIKMF